MQGVVRSAGSRRTRRITLAPSISGIEPSTMIAVGR